MYFREEKAEPLRGRGEEVEMGGIDVERAMQVGMSVKVDRGKGEREAEGES